MVCIHTWPYFVYWGWNQVSAILQMTFSNAFSWMKVYEFLLRFHRSLLLRFKLPYWWFNICSGNGLVKSANRPLDVTFFSLDMTVTPYGSIDLSQHWLPKLHGWVLKNLCCIAISQALHTASLEWGSLQKWSTSNSNAYIASCADYMMIRFWATWWRNQMEIFAMLLALCEGNSPVTGVFPSQRPVMWSFDVFFDLCLKKRLSKQSRHQWFEMPLRSLWHHNHCNDIVTSKSL